MAGIIGSSIMSALRLLTPGEINRITGINTKKKTNEAGQVITDEESSLINAGGSSNTDQAGNKSEDNVLLLKKDQSGEKKEPEDPYKSKPTSDQAPVPATVLNFSPINEEVTEDLAREGLLKAQSKAQTNLEQAGVYSAEKIREEEEKKRRDEKKLEDSSTVFLLKEKNKVKESQKKLKVKEVLESYRNNSKMDIQRQTDDEDLSISDNQGILLNKKQF